MMKPYVENRKARFTYEVLETFEGGLALTGAEAKGLREGGGKLDGAYLRIRNGELWLVGAYIRPYSKSVIEGQPAPDRDRKVLVHRHELERLAGKTQQKGLTLVPFSFYPNARRIKVAFSLCRGKKTHDKREKLKERDLIRQTARAHHEGRDE